MAESSPKRVAVIGAGPTGLSAVKSCKEENLDVVCFERNGHAGGLWRYRDEDIVGVASVMKTTIINTNKQLSAFSDFPPPEDYPNFMHNTQMCEYFMQYAKHFDVLKHIRYNKEVVKVEKTEDFIATGRWEVTVKDTTNEETETDVFDAIMVCIGHHVYPKIPEFPGQDMFKGRVLHTHSLKTTESFSGLNVVVVGIGNSGADATVDSAFTAKQVYLSTRRGSWIMARVGKRGVPYDFGFVNRLKLFIGQFRSFDSVCSEIEENLNERFDHALYNLKPKHRVLSAHPTANDNLPNLILAGRVIVKGNIKRFCEDGVIFEGDEEMTKVDVVVFATGYNLKFPFVSPEVLPVKDNIVDLYKYAIPVNYPTLAVISQIQPLGPIFPVGEMQTRWFVQLLVGNVKLPSVEDMQKDIEIKRAANAKRYVTSTRHTIQVDFVPFMDEMASLIGAKPDLFKLAFSDQKLFWTCLTEPCLPYQYRINGPHKWDGAREALFNYKKSFMKPLSTRHSNGSISPASEEEGMKSPDGVASSDDPVSDAEKQTQQGCGKCQNAFLFLFFLILLFAIVLNFVF